MPAQLISPTAERLSFGSDQAPGIRRTGGTRFRYVNELNGAPASGVDIARIRALAIPPAWVHVWIAEDPSSHLQATGRDARGRKQYRYHDAFTASRAEIKFADLLAFGFSLGALRRRVARDMGRNDLGHDRVVATVIRLMDITSLRIGNVEYATTNESFGLTTLHNEHVSVRGSTIRLAFRGKSSHDFDVRVDNARLARIVRHCQHLPGQQLFAYRAEGGDTRYVSSSDVNSYLGEHAAPGVTAKTFRTWNATVRAADGLAVATEHDENTPSARVLNDVIDSVADHLGNTRSVCRRSYVHPAVIESYFQEILLPGWRRHVGAKPTGLTVAERKTLRLLRRADAS